MERKYSAQAVVRFLALSAPKLYGANYTLYRYSMLCCATIWAGVSVDKKHYYLYNFMLMPHNTIFLVRGKITLHSYECRITYNSIQYNDGGRLEATQ